MVQVVPVFISMRCNLCTRSAQPTLPLIMIVC